jgi:hypothetical protein
MCTPLQCAGRPFARYLAGEIMRNSLESAGSPSSSASWTSAPASLDASSASPASLDSASHAVSNFRSSLISSRSSLMTRSRCCSSGSSWPRSSVLALLAKQQHSRASAKRTAVDICPKVFVTGVGAASPPTVAAKSVWCPMSLDAPTICLCNFRTARNSFEWNSKCWQNGRRHSAAHPCLFRSRTSVPSVRSGSAGIRFGDGYKELQRSAP